MQVGVNPNYRLDDGWTALHCAASEGHERVCEVLVDSGAVVNMKSKSGEYPLELAIRQNHADVVHFLIGCGAMIDVPSSEGKTLENISSTEIIQSTLKSRRQNLDARLF